MFLDIVSKVRKTVTAKDLPEPRPPVIIKYLASELNKVIFITQYQFLQMLLKAY